MIETEIVTDYMGNLFHVIKGTNLLHNESGPALIKYDGVEGYYIDGGYMTKNEFLIHKRKIIIDKL